MYVGWTNGRASGDSIPRYNIGDRLIVTKPDPVEEALKREEIKPDSTVTRNFFLVKEALKKELGI